MKANKAVEPTTMCNDSLLTFDYTKAASSAIAGTALAVIFHYAYNRLLESLSRQSENI